MSDLAALGGTNVVVGEVADDSQQTIGLRTGAFALGTGLVLEIGNIVIPDVRLRASELDDDGEMLVTPKVGSAVIVGSLSGDLAQLVVLQVDHIETIVINGGKLGGLINIEQLTRKINDLVDTFNRHTHQVTVQHPGGTFTTVKPGSEASSFNKGDYEDSKITH